MPVPRSSVIPTSLARVPGRTQKSPGGKFRVSPRNLLCGVSLPGRATTGVGPHRSVASFDDLNQASDEVDGVRTVIPFAANSVDLHGGWLVHTFLLGAKVRLGRRGEAPAEPRGYQDPSTLMARDG